MVNPLLDAGQLPYLGGLIEKGVVGTMLSPGPPIGAIAYNTVATGTYAYRHGVLGTYEVRDDHTVAPVNSLSRHRKAFWQVLSDNGRRCHVVNFPTTGPAERVNGVFISPAFFSTIPTSYRDAFDVPADNISPPDLLEPLKRQIVSLEDIDAQVMAMFVPGIKELGEDYRRLAPIASVVTRTFSVHAATTWLIDNTDWDVISVNYPAINLLWGEFGHYRAGQRPGVDRREQDLFGQVGDSAVQLCDLLLGRLLTLCGEHTAVVVYSPLGYALSQQFDQEGPSARLKRRGPARTSGGIFVMRAPGVREDELLHRVSSVDLCPTVLCLNGLTLTDNLDGGVPQGAFVEPGAPIGTVQAGPTESADRPSKQELSAVIRWQEAMEFSAPYSGRAAWRVQVDNDWNLVSVLLALHQPQRALPLLVRLYATNPLQVNRAVMAAEAFYLAGLVPETLAVMGAIAQTFPQSPTGQFMAGMIALREGDIYRALDLLEASVHENPPIPELFFYLGHVYMQVAKVPRAIQAYQRSVEIAPDVARGYLGLTDALYRSGQCEPAAQAALSAIGLDFADPAGHIALGKALAKLGRNDQARQAFETSLRSDEDNVTARRWLARLNRDGRSDEGAGTDEDVPSASLLNRYRRMDHLACQEAVKRARQEVTVWTHRFIDELKAADHHLDAYLAANAAARQAPWPPALTGTEGGHDELEFEDADWMIRPALPSDQPALRRAFEDIFARPYDTDILVIHPASRRDVHGVVAIQLVGEQGQGADLRVSVGDELVSRHDDETKHYLTSRLLRAAVACAAARGTSQVTYTVSDAHDQLPLRRGLERLGFDAASVQASYLMNSNVIQSFGGRCSRLFGRYRQKKGVPEDVRLVCLTDVPYEQVDQFLRKFFPDGAGAPVARLCPPLCPVIVEGEEVIAAFVGHLRGEETFVVARLGVSALHQKGWVFPGLIGPGLEKIYASGCRTMQFFIDEDKFPEFAKVARNMEAELTGHILLMELQLSVPWPSGE
jgi:tetratricopeptide (TPR) repeat protein